jgi:hypothetical protein
MRPAEDAEVVQYDYFRNNCHYYIVYYLIYFLFGLVCVLQHWALLPPFHQDRHGDAIQ